MRLWSVVVTHETQPRGSGSTLRTVISGTRTAVSVAAIAQVLLGGALGRVGGRSGLLRPRPWCRRGLRRLVALHVGLGDLGPARLRELVGLFDRGLLLGQPGLELGRRDRVDAGDHVGVVAPAQLGALPAIDAWLGDLEPREVRMAGHG